MAVTVLYVPSLPDSGGAANGSSQVPNLAVTVLDVPSSLDSGGTAPRRRTSRGAPRPSLGLRSIGSSQGQNLAMTVLCVPSSRPSLGPRALQEELNPTSEIGHVRTVNPQNPGLAAYS